MNTRRSFIRLTCLAALGGLASRKLLLANEAADPSEVGIQFFGAAGRVSGSMALVSVPGDKIIIDCGSFYDEGGDATKLNAEIPAAALGASILVLTHAHADHVGRTTLLLDKGFKGTIAATEPTLLLMRVMLIMGARYSSSPSRVWTWSGRRKAPAGQIEVFTLHWHPKCQWRNSISTKNNRSATGSWADLKKRAHRDKAEASPCKTCGALEAEPTMKRCRRIVVGNPFSVGTHTTVTAFNAGHIPGSVSLHLECSLPRGRKRSVLFSGDIGPKQPLLQHGFDQPS